MRLRLFLILTVLIFGFRTGAFAQVSDSGPQGQTGQPRFGSFAGGDIDTINVYNGNLNLVIPLFSLPGREISLDIRVVYNSLKWEITDLFDNLDSTYSGGWRISDPIGEAPAFRVDYVDCVADRPGPFKHVWQLRAIWKDGLGTKHLFTDIHEVMAQNCDPESMPETPAINNRRFRETGGGVYAELLTGSTRADDVLKFIDGTIVRFPAAAKLLTANLNKLVRTTGGLMDTVGRTITFVDSSVQNDIYSRTYTVTDSNGTPQTYTLNYRNGTEVCNPITLENETRDDRLESIVFPGGQTYSFEYPSSAPLHGYLTKVTLPSGAFIEYAYPENVCTALHKDYVTFRKVSKGVGATPSIWKYERVDLSDNGREVTVTSPDETTTVVHTFNGQGQEEQTVWKEGTIANPGSVERQRVGRSWSGNLPTATHTLRDGLQQTTTRQFDSLGLTAAFQWETDWHPVNVSGTVIRELREEWALQCYLTCNSTQPLRFLRNWSELYGIDPTAVSQVLELQGKTVYGYDEFAFDSAQIHSGVVAHQPAINPAHTGRGNLTTVHSFKDAATSVETQFRYDNLGNRVKTIDPLGRITNISYDDNFTVAPSVVTFAYPTRVTNAKNQFASTKYNWDTGLPVESTDVREKLSTLHYDGLGRLDTVTTPGAGSTPGNGEMATTYNDTARTIQTAVKTEDGKWLRSETLFDPLYRPVKETQFELSSSDYVYADTEYDINGRAYRVSSPHREGETPRWTTTTEYDGLSRPKTVKNPDESLVHLEYGASSAGQTVKTTDENGIARRMTYNGLGQMVMVEEPNPTLTTPRVTAYSYYVSGALHKVEQGAQTRTFTVNWLGQTENEKHPEAGQTADPGQTTFEYYADGQLKSRTDARGVGLKATYTYDEIGRPKTIDYADDTPDVIYDYDEGGFTGLLTHVTAVGVTGSEFTYDDAGQLKTEETTFSGVGSFTTEYDYDKAGRLTKIQYPSGRTVTRKYLSSGSTASNRLENIQDDKTAATVLSEVTETTDSLSRKLGGGAITETWNFNTRSQLSSIQASTGGPALLSMTYGYGPAANNNGRIRSRTDNLQPEHSASYSYDTMNRLEQAANPSWSIGWELDDYGNRTAQTPAGLAIGRVGTPQISINAAKNRNNSWQYDAAGNVIADGIAGHTYQYDAESRLRRIEDEDITFYYDAGGRRIAKEVGSEMTIYLYGLTGLLSEFTTTNSGTFLPAATDRLEYRVAEQTGTPVLLLDAAGTPIEANRVFPFGEPWQESAASTNNQTFTTYDRDNQSQLDYAMARHYAFASGRFVSPDPGHVGANLGDPQSWNAYAYVGNDPINFTDPDGLCRVSGVEYPDGGPKCPDITSVTVTAPRPTGGGPLGLGPCFDPEFAHDCIPARLPLDGDPSVPSEKTGLIGRVVDLLVDWRERTQKEDAARNAWCAEHRKDVALNSWGFKANTREWEQRCIILAIAPPVGPGRVKALVQTVFEWHHVVPKYLGGMKNGLLVRIPKEYHQLITNAFRKAWEYGQDPPTQKELIRILEKIYSQFPLPK